MARSSKQSSGFWGWLILGIVVAALVLGVFFYIGWFDAETHVDTPAGDNVTQQYELTEPQADAPGEADWQNADHQSLRELITEPASEATTSPSSAE
ncbi:MAG: hypothetical protein HDS72_03400 [Bacteroidales bacterium]|nr:hypothetical protein [Bacteroidales bacterium]